MKEVKDYDIICTKSIGEFKEGNIYKTNGRLFHKSYPVVDENDKYIIVVESDVEDSDLQNCYFLSLEQIYEHFNKI